MLGVGSGRGEVNGGKGDIYYTFNNKKITQAQGLGVMLLLPLIHFKVLVDKSLSFMSLKYPSNLFTLLLFVCLEIFYYLHLT